MPLAGQKLFPMCGEQLPWSHFDDRQHGGATLIGLPIGSAIASATAETAKNLYTLLYIYAKREAVLHKYTVVTAAFRDIISSFFWQTRTTFGAIGAVSGHGEGRKSNNILQNRGYLRLFRRYFRLWRGRFSGAPRRSFWRSRWSLRF